MGDSTTRVVLVWCVDLGPPFLTLPCRRGCRAKYAILLPVDSCMIFYMTGGCKVFFPHPRSGVVRF